MKVGMFLITIITAALLAGSAPTNQRDGLPQDSSSTALPVKVLFTRDGIDEDGMHADRYPKSVSVTCPEGIWNQIGAYGGAYEVWIAPKGWTGSAASGADGNIVVRLFPPKGSMKSGPHVEYYEIPGCVGCMLSAAAPYFPQAMQDWNSQFNQDGKTPIEIPHGLKVTSMSPTLLTYTLPDTNGLSLRGVVYYDSAMDSDMPFAQAEFDVPTQDSTLVDFLLHTFISREGLK